MRPMVRPRADNLEARPPGVRRGSWRAPVHNISSGMDSLTCVPEPTRLDRYPSATSLVDSVDHGVLREMRRSPASSREAGR
jgi:hypothetical protein